MPCSSAAAHASPSSRPSDLKTSSPSVGRLGSACTTGFGHPCPASSLHRYASASKSGQLPRVESCVRRPTSISLICANASVRAARSPSPSRCSSPLPIRATSGWSCRRSNRSGCPSPCRTRFCQSSGSTSAGRPSSSTPISRRRSATTSETLRAPWQRAFPPAPYR